MDNKNRHQRVPILITAITALLILVFLITSFYPDKLNAQSEVKNDLKVMTFNIRYGTAQDGENSWEFRKDNVVKTIQSVDPDLLGLQEALEFQINELLSQMPGYYYAGAGRDDGKTEGEYSCIFYRRNRFEVDSSSTFWFSETPSVVASKNWGNNITRICTWVLLHDKFSGKDFYFFNVHLDHESQLSREKSAELLIERINEKSMPVILSGDFNCGETNSAIRTILSGGLRDTYRTLHARQPDEGTFNSFKGEKRGEKIDFIFVTPNFSTKQSEIIRTEYNGKFPSDHFPVTAIIYPD